MWNQAWSVFRTPAVQRTALVVAAVAGTLLNCINQLPNLMDGEAIDIVKLMLTYLVPYAVSMTSAIMLVSKQKRMAEAKTESDQ